jgi:hypothetical protein
MEWIEVEKELPPPNTRVKLSYGLFGIRGVVVDDWVTEGWIRPSGVWSIKQKYGVVRGQKPTHWKWID